VSRKCAARRFAALSLMLPPDAWTVGSSSSAVSERMDGTVRMGHTPLGTVGPIGAGAGQVRAKPGSRALAVLALASVRALRPCWRTDRISPDHSFVRNGALGVT
jgi:hypothetical protein